ncbi:hypothetical protein G6F50_016547 [Rhizopus delemar]|uniref:Uncharacterized protein n=1 Tax=Rhizopus delemar TaxID=936053 RepID=A0A9P7C1W4_9FUNG|nr:hypothetical protein G6F50_016547 [Rhizopus delemar]
MPSLAWAAAYATGGSSPYRNTVLWLTWGGGANGVNNVALNDGAMSSIDMPVAAGVNLRVDCRLNTAETNVLRSYRPGNFAAPPASASPVRRPWAAPRTACAAW